MSSPRSRQVKPAGAYLDIIREVADLSDLPVAAYQVRAHAALCVCVH
jgi:delta-aminolevulinic acid dehydratase/porphobilinogen synthase